MSLQLDTLQWLLLDMVTILECSVKNLHHLADASLSFSLPSYLSPACPTIVNVVVIAASDKSFLFSVWPAEGLHSPPLLDLGANQWFPGVHRGGPAT